MRPGRRRAVSIGCEVADVPLAFHVSCPSGCALHYFDHIQTLAQNPLRSNAESKPLSYV
jgi:hypothetical protein